MPKYEINSSTLSFLQFNDPNDKFKDTISNNSRKWEIFKATRRDRLTGSENYSLVKTKRVSKPYSLKLYSYNSNGKSPYYDGEIDYSYKDTGMFESSFTLDFWCCNIKETGIKITYNLTNPYDNNGESAINNYLGDFGNSDIDCTLFELHTYQTVKVQLPRYYGTLHKQETRLQTFEFPSISDAESNKYNHIAITFDAKTKKVSFFFNGKLLMSDSNSTLVGFFQMFINSGEFSPNYKDYYFGFRIFADTRNVSHSTSATSYIDNLRISNKVLWDADFEPPGVDSKQLFYNNGNAFGVINGTSQLLSSNWDLLTDDQKISIINSLDYDIMPSPEEMTKFIDDDSFSDIDSKIYSFQKEMGTKNFVIEEKDNKRSELILPKKLIDIDTFGTNIIQANPKYIISTSSNSTIKIAVTEDLKYYKTFNFTNQRWELIDSSEIETKGIDISQLAAITEDFWSQLGTDIAFGYCLIRNSNVDTVSMDELDFKMDLSKYWKEVNFDSQANYKYCSPSNLRVILKESGDYKIIYREQKLEEGDN